MYASIWIVANHHSCSHGPKVRDLSLPRDNSSEFTILETTWTLSDGGHMLQNELEAKEKLS